MGIDLSSPKVSDGIRTRDTRNHNPDSGKSKSFNDKELQNSALSACGNSPVFGADLSAIIDAWPTLPEPLRKGILTMVELSIGKQ